ncbi:GerMN domain-containing protein [Desulfosporosinus hippei]|uniref:Sporulation and spore germination n=1 Tax=Desulfosporosinus hippei DSM 8344 TaxID=1121419 RepID=A0A1G7YQ58_9FIRM|nr:GerMN domain-containing protein [Desulfosporosinus hippei]SDG98415.1 Sporulation and spore germination [Desulfosporosinus hippei DSM 8344]
MKKLVYLISILLTLALLNGCANKGGTAPSKPDDKPQETKTLSIQDYCSFKENTNYVYEGKGIEYASYNVMVDYIEGNRIQTRSNNGGTETVKVLELDNGKLTLRLARGESYFRENLLQSPGNSEEILLQEPLVVGTSWVLADGRKRSITNIEADITTPSGTYKTLEVTTEGKADKTQDYYAPNIGLVKSVFTSDDFVVTSTLSKLESDVSLNQTVKFYYPNNNVDKLYFVSKKLSFKTNDLTKASFERAFKELPKGDVVPVLGPNVKIKSLYLNKDNAVYVDFSKELRGEMIAGSSYEGLILQSITNTLGNYYGVDKVYITVEGNPYASGHYAMNKGEYFSVDLSNSTELK